MEIEQEIRHLEAMLPPDLRKHPEAPPPAREETLELVAARNAELWCRAVNPARRADLTYAYSAGFLYAVMNYDKIMTVIGKAPPAPPQAPQGSQDTMIEKARSLHRVVRALHDGHCPSCGHIFPSAELLRADMRETCPRCGFFITNEEAKAACNEFAPIMRRNLDVFNTWVMERAQRCQGTVHGG